MTDPPPGRGWGGGGPVADAFEAVRAQADGKSREEITQLLTSELTARGVELPETLIGSMADVLAHPHRLSARLRALRGEWRVLAEIVSHARSVSDIFEGKDTGTGAISDSGGRPPGWVEVILDDHGKAVLRSRRTRLGLPAGTRDQVAVRLERTGHGPVDAYVDTEFPRSHGCYRDFAVGSQSSELAGPGSRDAAHRRAERPDLSHDSHCLGAVLFRSLPGRQGLKPMLAGMDRAVRPLGLLCVCLGGARPVLQLLGQAGELVAALPV